MHLILYYNESISISTELLTRVQSLPIAEWFQFEKAHWYDYCFRYKAKDGYAISELPRIFDVGNNEGHSGWQAHMFVNRLLHKWNGIILIGQLVVLEEKQNPYSPLFLLPWNCIEMINSYLSRDLHEFSTMDPLDGLSDLMQKI